jgi:hypothetical protein
LTVLVHIAAENLATRIARNGISPVQGFVWAFPMLESYTLTHSWSREMKCIAPVKAALRSSG